MNKHDLTREMLIDNGVRIEFDENNQPLVFQKRENTPKRGRKWQEERKIYDSVCNHKYGKAMTYKAVNLYLEGKFQVFIVSSIIWVYFNGSIPEGYDVDHIDNNPFNNSLDNLQLLTRQENLLKRGLGTNQHTVNMDPELRLEYKAQQKIIREMYDNTKKELAECRKHMAECKKNMKLHDNKYQYYKEIERRLIEKKKILGRNNSYKYSDLTFLEDLD